jgi:cysteine desulfurase/selenocysteine lyase
MQRFGISGTARASLAMYNNHDDVDRLVEALEKARQIFG